MSRFNTEGAPRLLPRRYQASLQQADQYVCSDMYVDLDLYMFI